MQAFNFTFTGDASGSPDEIRLPQDFPIGKRTILIRPPAGHAWAFYGFGKTTGGYPLDTDRELMLPRQGEGSFSPYEVIGAVSLDSGTGTFSALAL